MNIEMKTVMKRNISKNIYGTIAVYCLLALSTLFTLSACSSDDDATSKVAPASTGTYTDTRDGHTYEWVRYGNLEWMTENLRYDINDKTNSSIYQPVNNFYNNTDTTNLAKYGRLYTQSGAQTACPDGWRVPTDADWQNLEQSLGMSASDASQYEWRGNVASTMLTLQGDTSALNLKLGGFYDKFVVGGNTNWRFMGCFAFYWTSTQDNTKTGIYYFYRKLAYNRTDVYRQSMIPNSNMLSVRLVRDAKQ